VSPDAVAGDHIHERGTFMSEASQQSAAARMLGDFAPKRVSLTDEVLFGDVWERTKVSPRDRSLVTITALVAAVDA
jgi:4-carboxymuconolactone decarboxylase